MRFNKSKCLSLWMATATLTAAATITPIAIVCCNHETPTATHDRKHSPTKISSREQKVDYLEVRNFLNSNNFKSLNNVNLQLSKLNLKQIEIPEGKELNLEQLDKVHKMQNKYLDHFEKNDFNLGQVDDYLKNNFSQYSAIEQEINSKYTDAKIPKTHQQAFLFTSGSVVFVSDNELETTFSDLIHELDKLRDILVGITVAAAAAAAGFWATSYWFGITIPWAIAATNITASSKLCLDKVIIEIGELSGALSPTTGEMIISYGKALKKITDFEDTIEIVFNAWKAVAALNIWAFPPATVVTIAINVFVETITDQSIEKVKKYLESKR